MAQPAPLPEQIFISSAGTVINHSLKMWGSSFPALDPLVHTAYQKTLEDPDHVHAICEEFRTAATVDRGHDQWDHNAGLKLNAGYWQSNQSKVA